MFIKIPIAFFHIYKIKNPEIYRELQKTPKTHIWRYHIPQFQSIFQSYSKQNSMVLAGKKVTEKWNKIESPALAGLALWTEHTPVG